MSYEQWDRIADSYTPVLFILYLAYSVVCFRAGNRAMPVKGFLGIVVCYALMAVDGWLGLWKSLSLDYSTHTAVAFALVFFHAYTRGIKNRLAIAIAASLPLYYILMLYQKYHSLADIVTTLVVVAPLVFVVYKMPIKFHGRHST